jgi:hypothetical protein
LIMSLKLGEWKMNDNGVEGALLIDNVDPNSGEISGRIGGQGGFEPFVGVWDETARTITVACPVYAAGGGPPGLPPPRVYKGFLFSTPRIPAPGQDVVWTLAGFVQLTDVATAVGMAGNARRTVFGWFAQVTEVG